MKTLKDLSIIGKRVLVRCDFNVPLDKKGNILDDFKIKQTLPTIKYLIENKAKIVLMSHLGDPDGKVVPNLKMDNVAERLASLLGFSIGKEKDCIGPEVEAESNSLESGTILLLENLKFHKEETDNDQNFARKLSYLGDIYINDAFATCHRKYASVSGVSRFLPSCAGLLLEKEVTSLNRIIKDPAKPLLAVVGGIKVETKSNFIDNISEIADFVLVGGLIAKGIKEKTKDGSLVLRFPEKIVYPVGPFEDLDISEETIKIFREKIMQAKTIFWNGPLGKFEDKKYEMGTLAVAQAIIESGAFSVAGGGETVEFLNKENIIDKFSHVSTGGGAMLSYLSGEKMPGLEVL